MSSTLGATRVASAPAQLDELLLYRRVAWRIMPLAIICFLFSYFDRINISFAKTQMQAELGLSDAAYGLAASMFFIGYVLFEVPSSWGLKKYGAPAWICRIMVSWGLATAALVFAYTQYTLYFLRFLIGVMEAGFGPAILFYLACWFPKKYLARVNGLWFLAVPLAGAVGGPAAGVLLGTMDGVLGLAGWHWLFLMSGLPCVVLGLLAATDAFPVYAMSHKYKRLYLRELGFRIFEYKPYPTDAPINVAATGVLGEERAAHLPMFGSGSSGSSSGPVPLKRAGIRVGLHAKSLVVDDRIGVVGSHNFDPRSDNLNTESMVVVHDLQFAAALRASIERDMVPANAWTIARQEKPPVFSGLNYSLGKISEKLPIFDIWPFPYASSFELREGCNPLPPEDPRFYACYEDVGAFPEVDLPLKTVYTRILTAFGAGLVPIL